MVKIVNGEIVPDDDPRAKHIGSASGSSSSSTSARPRGATSSQFFGGGSGTDNVNSSGSNSFQQFSTGPSGGNKSSSSSQNSRRSGPPGAFDGDNLITKELAGLLGIYGRRVNILGQDMPMIYAILIGVVVILYMMGQTEVLRIAGFCFLGYFLYQSFANKNTTGQNIGGMSSSSSGGGGGGGGNNKFQGGDSRAGGGAYRRPPGS